MLALAVQRRVVAWRRGVVVRPERWVFGAISSRANTCASRRDAGGTAGCAETGVTQAEAGRGGAAQAWRARKRDGTADRSKMLTFNVLTVGAEESNIESATNIEPKPVDLV